MTDVKLEVGAECRLESYEVSLREVGYGKRIISPKYYNANYCAGECSFPLQKVDNFMDTVRPNKHGNLMTMVYGGFI